MELGINVRNDDNLIILRKLMALALKKPEHIIPAFTACLDMSINLRN